MDEKDWIILRLLKAATPEFIRLTKHGQRDYTKAFIYLVKAHGSDLILGNIDQLTEEKKQHEAT